jgi:hypothetical protein
MDTVRNNSSEVAPKPTPLDEICVATFMVADIPATTEARALVESGKVFDGGVSIECARCARCVLFMAGVETPQNADCLYF